MAFDKRMETFALSVSVLSLKKHSFEISEKNHDYITNNQLNWKSIGKFTLKIFMKIDILSEVFAIHDKSLSRNENQ